MTPCFANAVTPTKLRMILSWSSNPNIQTVISPRFTGLQTCFEKCGLNGVMVPISIVYGQTLLTPGRHSESTSYTKRRASQRRTWTMFVLTPRHSSRLLGVSKPIGLSVSFCMLPMATGDSWSIAQRRFPSSGSDTMSWKPGHA
jgi:hypothetical protein